MDAIWGLSLVFLTATVLYRNNPYYRLAGYIFVALAVIPEFLWGVTDNWWQLTAEQRLAEKGQYLLFNSSIFATYWLMLSFFSNQRLWDWLILCCKALILCFLYALYCIFEYVYEITAGAPIELDILTLVSAAFYFHCANTVYKGRGQNGGYISVFAVLRRHIDNCWAGFKCHH